MAHLVGIQIGKHARAVAAALVIGMAVLSLSAGQAEARPRRPANTVVCWMHGNHYDDEWNAYAPGDVYFDPHTGQKYRCGSDGKWHPARLADDTVLHQPEDGGVLAPTP